MAQDIQTPPADAAKENKTKRKVTYTPVRTVSGSELREMAGDGSGVLENEWNDPGVRTFTEDGFKGVYSVQPPEKYHTDEDLEEAMPTGNAAGIGANMVFSGGAIPPSVARDLYKNETSRAGNTSERYARMKEERAWRDNEAKYAVESAIADGFKPDGTSMRNIQEKYVASYYYTSKGRDRYNRIKEETNRLKEYLTPYIEQETAGNPLYQKAVADYRAGKISMEQLAETQEMLRRESPSYKKAAEWSMQQNRQYAQEASDYFAPYMEKEMVPFMEQGLDKSISDFRSLQGERPDEFTGVADNLLNKAEKLRDAARNGGFLTGMGDTASDWNFWSLGIADLYRAKNIREIADKADKALREGADVEFTPEELNTLQAYAIYQQALNLYSEKVPLSYTMGQVTAEMIPFATSIALGQGLASLTTKGISAVAKKAATREVAQAVSQALGKSKLLNSRFAQGFRQGAGFGGGTTGAAGVAGNMLGGMTRGTGEALTVGAPRTWAEKNERMTGQADLDITDSGQPLITGFSGRESGGEAFARALAGNAIEYQSERAGQLMERLGGALKARLPKDLQLSMGYPGDYIKRITPKSLKRFYKSPYYKAFRDNIQLQGVWSEYGEEELANWERVLLGLDEPDVLLDNEQRVETFLSLLPAQLMMGAGAGIYSAGRYRQASARLDKLMKEMKASDPELYEKYGKVRGEMDGFDMEAVTGLLSSIDRDGKLNAGQKTEVKRAALTEYYTKMLKSAQEAEIFGRADEEMRQAYEQAEALKERGSGNIVTADYEGRKVNITDDTGSDTVVIEYVEEDGKRVKRQVPRSAVGNAATVPVADVVNSKADEITARVKAEMQDLEHPGVAAPEPGTRLVHNGENYAVTSISPDGVVIMREDEEGNYSLPEVISTDTYYAEKQAEIDAQEQEQQPQSGEGGEAAQEIASPAEEEPAPVTGGGAVQEETALGRMPKDEQGQPLYEQADAETAWDALLEQAGGDEAMAQEVANDIVSEQEKALKAAERELKKVQDGKPQQRKVDAPLTVEARIAAKQAVREQTSRAQAGVDEARKRLEAWRKIAETSQRRRQAIEAERRQEEKEAARLRGIQEEQERAEREEAERIRREALNGVPDFIEDRPQDARARGYRRVNGNRVDRQQPIQARRGGEVQVKFDDNNIPAGHVALIEASQLQPSHTDGRRNPRHFIDEAQPKERNDEASVMSSRKIAANIRPEEITSSVTAYTGAPTVNSRGEVIQGNNRSAALREMWAEHPEQAAKYRQYLADHAADFGLTPEDVEAMQQPVLVNMLDVTDDEAITLGQFVAQDTESGGTERIKPKNMVRKMGDDMRGFANRLLASADEEMSFAELVDRNGVDVLKWMQQKGYITPTQYKSAFDSKGNLTAEAKNDLKGVMYQSIFQNGSTHLEEMFNALPAKAQKAILATAYRDYDSPNPERMIEEIQDSISAYYALSQDAAFAGARNYKEARIAAEAWKRQYAFDDATGESYLPSERYSNFALLLATMYKGQTQTFIQNTLGHIYDLVQGTQEADLFNQPDNTPRTLVQAINETLGNLREELLLNENFTYNGQRRSNVLAGGSASGQRGRQGSDGNAPSGGRAENGTRQADNSRRTETDSGEGVSERITPIRESRFGFVYDQFRGKAREAFDFLRKEKSGYLRGVFHRDDIGDIDLVWGDSPTRHSGKGLAHIIRKHVETLHDFNSAEEAFDVISGVVNDGTVSEGQVPNTYNIEKGNYRVVVAKDAIGNWVLTAFDFKRPASTKKKGTPAALTPGETASADGAGAVAPNLSGSKDKKTSGKRQQPDGKKRGRKQIEKAIGMLREGLASDDFGTVRRALGMYWTNQYNGAEITEEEAAFVDGVLDNYRQQGIEIINPLGTRYDEGMKVVAEFRTDDTLKPGENRIVGVREPQVNTDGVMSHSASITVAISPVAEENGADVQGNADENIRRAESEVDRNPSEAQKEAGNYRKGHVRVDGLDVTIENPKGNVRSGTDANGKRWETVMNNTYGYMRGTEGVDGDHIDVFLSDSPESGNVYVVDQRDPETGEFDEHKVMYGFGSMEEARDAYLKNYEPGWQGLGTITEVSKDEFRKWIGSSKRKTKPFAEYRSVKKEAGQNEVNSPANIQPIATGDFGPIYDQFVGKPKEAIEFLSERQGGEAKGALHHKDVGNIDLVWGNEKMGLLHIIDKHPEVLENLQGKLNDMHIVSSSDNRIVLESDTHKAVVNNNWYGKKTDNWLLTTYEKKKGVSGGSIDIDPEPVGKQNGTAPLQNTLSTDKDNDKSEPTQTSAEKTGEEWQPHALPGRLMKAYESGDEALIAAVEQDMRNFVNAAKDMRSVYVTYLRSKDLERSMEKGSPSNKTQHFIAEACKDALKKAGLPVKAMQSERARTDVAGSTTNARVLDIMSADTSFNVLRAIVHNPNISEATLKYFTEAFSNNGLDYEAQQVLDKRSQERKKEEANIASEEAAIRDAIVERLRESGIEVITDAEAGQRVLDEANGRGEPVRTQAMLDGLAKAASTIRGWIKGNRRGRVFTIDLPESTQRKIKEAMGRDFDSHNITANGIAHALKNHGVGGDKLNDRSIPLREEDMELIPYIMTAPDYVKKASTDVSGRESVRFYKNLSNGYVVVVEKEYKNSPYDMETITMWAELSSGATNARQNAVPDTHVLNAIPDTDSAKIRKDAEDAIRGDEKVREHRVYHGSGADFEAFDHSHMGEGEGAQAYGWGSYVTEVENIGRMYAESMSRRGNHITYDGEKLGDVLDNEYYFDETWRNWKRHLLSATTAEDLKSRILNLYFFPKGKGSRERKKAFEQQKKELLADIDNGRVKVDLPRHLYTVEIPDDTGGNYIDWDEPVTKEQQGKIYKQLRDEKTTLDGATADFWNGKSHVWDSGREFYSFLDYCFIDINENNDSQKAASEFLSRAGFTGIKYPAQYRSGGREDGAKNYVIFNENDLKITSHVRFFRTQNGEAYGFTVGGKIYIDPRVATADTPIHEYAHLWASALRQGNPEEWRNVVGLMKDTPVWDEVKRLYPELETDDELADEALAIYSGRRGAERLREAARRAWNGSVDLDIKAASARAMGRVRDALRRFWRNVADFLHIRYTSAEEVADRVMRDLLEGVNPNRIKSATDNTGAFSAGNDDIRYRMADEDDANRRFNEELDKWESGGMPANEYVTVGNPVGVLRHFTPDLPIILRQKVLSKSRKKHGLSASDMRNLPVALSEPIFIFKSTDNTIGVLTELVSGSGENIFVAIELDANRQMGHQILEVNDILTIHGRETENIINPITDNGSLVWADKEKGLNWLSSAKSNSQAVTNEALDTATNIVKDFENPSLEDENLFRIGETKRIGRQGKKITFTRANPTVTLNALKKRLENEGVEYKVHKARTGSGYISFEREGIYYDLRSANHTRAYTSYNASDDTGGVELSFTREDGRIDGIDIDLSENEMGVNEIYSLMDEAARFNANDTGMFAVTERLVYPEEINGYEYIAAALGKKADDLIREREMALRAEYARYKDTALQGYERPNLLPFKAGNGAVVEDESVRKVYFNGKPAFKRYATEALSEYFRERNKAMRDFEAAHAMSYDEWLASAHPEIRQEEDNMRDGTGAVTDDEVSMENDPMSKLAGKSIRTRKQRQAFAERERRRMAGAVREMAERLHLDDVEVVTDASTLTGRRARAKGFYSPHTGKITIVIPNHASEADAVQTLLHEAVAHKGLRQLFGEHFDTFLWNVYRNADRDVRERINALASEKGWDFPTATEEYLASLAENTDFENAQRSGWWEKIKRLFIDMLHKIGLDGFGGVTLSDNELRYILWRSYENLREPGAERSITGVAADVVKQAELKVGNYAEDATGGDMAAERKSAMTEKQRRIEKLRRSEPVMLKGDEYKGKYELNRESAKQWIKDNLRGEYVNKDTGERIEIRKDGAQKVTSHSMGNEAHLKSLAAIPQMIENSIFIDELPNEKDNGKYDSYRYYVCGLKIGGVDYTAKITVGVKGTSKYYDHALTEIEKGNLLDNIDALSTTFDNKENADNVGFISTEAKPDPSVTGIKDTKLVSILQTDEEENEDELMYRDGGAEEDGQRKRGFMADMRLAWNNLVRLMNPTKGNDLITEAARQAAAIKPDDAQRKKKLRRLNAAVNLAIASTKMHESYVDKAVSLRPLLAAVEGWTGRPLADEFNIYLHYDKYTSLHQAGVKEFYENEYADFMEAVSAVMETKGCKVEDVWNYMFLKHGLERNSVMAKRDADREFRKGETDKSPQELYEDNRKKEYSGVRAVLESMGMNTEGMTLQEVEKEAEKHVKDFEVGVTGNTIDNLWDKTRRATSFAIEREYRAGILSRQQRDDILNMYQYYIPLRGWADPKAEELFSYDSSLDSGYSVPEKQSKGRKSVADSPAAYIAAAAQTAIIRSVRNEMKKQIYYLAELTKGSGLMSVGNVWEVQDATGDWSIQTAQITDDMTAEQADAETARFEKEMGVLARQGKARLQGEDMEIAGGRKLSKEQLREHQVYVKINGRTKIVTVNTDNSVAKAINNSFSNIDNNRMMMGWMTFQRFMAGMMTQFNPEFIISNLLRDMTSAMTYGGPVNIGREVPAAVEDAVNYFIRKKKLTETDALFQEFIRGGGETGYVHLLELSKIDKDFRNEIRRLKGGAAYNILHKNLFAKYLDYVSRANEAVEVLTRYAAYRAARKEGKSISRAIDDAKNITANFNRKGSQTMVTGYGAPLAVLTALSPILPRMYAFFNAAIQGAYAFFRAAARNPLRVWPIVALSFAEGILQAFLGDGDDDEDKYQYINDYLKRSTISFVAGDKHSVSIPMAYELSAWHAIGHMLYETVNGDMDVPTFAMESLSTICSSFTPVAFDGIQRYYEDNEYHYMLSPFLPTNLTPIGELLENRDWLGSPIARKNMWNASQPEYRRVYERTGQFYVEASKWLNYVSGGNDVEKGAVNINPAQVEHFIEGYFSGTGRFYSRMAGVLYDLLTEGELRDASEMPVISRFVKPLNFNSIVNKQRSRLYDDMHAGADKAEWLDSYMKGESGEDAMTVSKRIGELLQDAEYLKYKRAKKVLEATKELEVLHETAENAGDKDVAEKIEERIKRMYDDYEEYADQIDGKSD